MGQSQFANQRALIEYAEAHDLAYAWEGSNVFAKRWRLAQLAQPGQYQLVDVPTKRGISRALLFPRAILRTEAEADRPFREAMAIKRERLAAKRAAKEKRGRGGSG
jgi:hypothetical protein